MDPKANDLAIQVLGGAGYTRGIPVEQWLGRDKTVSILFMKGQHGIQALDC